MKKTILLSLVLVFVLAFGSLSVSLAQDPTATADPNAAPVEGATAEAAPMEGATAEPVDGGAAVAPGVACDSTLTLLLFLAQASGFTSPSLNSSMFDYGQYTPWFQTINMEMNSGTSSAEGEAAATADAAAAEGMATAEAGAVEGEATAEASAGDAGAATSQFTTLNPGIVSGEDPLCTQLRAEVEAYLFQVIAGSAPQ